MLMDHLKRIPQQKYKQNPHIGYMQYVFPTQLYNSPIINAACTVHSNSNTVKKNISIQAAPATKSVHTQTTLNLDSILIHDFFTK